jgi:CheY-like chemotaxis protein
MITVLYVSDDLSLLEVSRIFLERSGLLSVQISLNDPGLRQRISYNSFDIILTDDEMAGMNGIEFVKEIRSTKNSIPVIITTRSGSATLKDEALELGAIVYNNQNQDPTPWFDGIELLIKLIIVSRPVSDRCSINDCLLAMLAEIPEITSHVKTMDRLFREFIHRAMSSGKFLYGATGLVDASCTRVYPVTCCRNFHDSIKMIRIPQNGEFVCPDPVVQVIRKKQHIICNEIDWSVGEWCSFARARPNCRSTATFPLVIGDQIAGIFQVSLEKPDFFGPLKSIYLLKFQARHRQFWNKSKIMKKSFKIKKANSPMM